MHSTPCLPTQNMVDAQKLKDALESKISWKQAVDRAMRPAPPLPSEGLSKVGPAQPAPGGVDMLLPSGLCHARTAAGTGSGRSSPQLGACRDLHTHTPSMRYPAAATGPPVAAASPRPLRRPPAAGEPVIVAGVTGARPARVQMPQPVATAPGGYSFMLPGQAG